MSLTKDRTVVDALPASGLSGKAITALNVRHVGSLTVVEVLYSGGAGYVKVNQGLAESGGTQEWGTGTVLPNGA